MTINFPGFAAESSLCGNKTSPRLCLTSQEKNLDLIYPALPINPDSGPLNFCRLYCAIDRSIEIYECSVFDGPFYSHCVMNANVDYILCATDCSNSN